LNLKKTILIGFIIFLSSVGVSHVYAQGESTTDYTLLSQILGFSTFIAAGMYYTTTGYISKIAKSLSGEDVSVDWVKVGKTTLLGVIIGVGAFMYVAMDDNTVIHVSSVSEFLAQASINFVIVVSIHKIILAPYSKKTNDDIELEDIDRENVPSDLPPERGV
jgi:hypothetical protein